MTIGDDENIKKLSDKLRELAQRQDAKVRNDLKPTKHLPTIAEIITEGEKLLAEDARLKKAIGCVPEKSPKTKTSLTNSNPYVKAREKILSEYPEWRRNEIAKMEKTGDTDNRFYAVFVEEIATIGDKFSS